MRGKNIENRSRPPFRWLLLINKGDKPIWEEETVHTSSQVIWQTLGDLLEMIHQL